MIKRRETFCRYVVFIFGLAVMALAVSIMSKANLGISPVQSLCYVIYRRFPEQISFGTMIFLWNFLLIAAQLPFLKKRFGWKNIIQIPLSFFLSFMVDVINGALAWFTPESVFARVMTMLCGVVVLAFSISVTVAAKAVMNPGEAFVAVLADTLSKPFGQIKAFFDISIITVSIITTVLLFGKWRLDIIGIGTVTAALLTGVMVSVINKFVEPMVEKICIGGNEKL